jgi:hypothetical protein
MRSAAGGVWGSAWFIGEVIPVALLMRGLASRLRGTRQLLASARSG